MGLQVAEAIINRDYGRLKRLQIELPSQIDEPYCDELPESITGRKFAALFTVDDWIKTPTRLSNLAAADGDLDIFKCIVEYSRASFNLADEYGRTELHYAAPTDNVELVKYMVERVGLSGLKGDKKLITPYDLAVKSGAKKVQAYFTEKYGAYEDMYRNPIRTGMHPDPSILRVGEDYYMVNSSFVFFPCIPISHSKDLIHWEVIGHAITNPEYAGRYALPEGEANAHKINPDGSYSEELVAEAAALNELGGGRGYWAPDISYYEGRFYITATYRLNDEGTVIRRQMVTSSEKPEGPYCEPTFIDEDGIDPSIFTDDDGRRYMLLNRGARLFEISPDGKRKLSEASLLYYGHQKRAPEGSHLLKKDGYYYLFQAEGGTGEGHRISVSRSESLFGVYEPCPYNPIVRQKDPDALIKRCGHGKPVMTQNGEWYIPYLCGRQVDNRYSMLGRETAIDKLTWTADGWPIANNLEGPSVLAKKPDLPEWKADNKASDTSKGFLEGFEKEWGFVRVPEEKAIRVENGSLMLKATHHSLSTPAARNIFVRSQNDFVFSAGCVVNLAKSKLAVGDELGMTAYYDENTYLTFRVKKEASSYKVSVFEHIGCEDRESEAFMVNDGTESICLKMDVDYLKRSFSLSTDGVNYTRLYHNDNVNYLCDEALPGKRFTGAMVGIYAYGPDTDFYGVFDGFSYTV